MYKILVTGIIVLCILIAYLNIKLDKEEVEKDSKEKKEVEVFKSLFAHSTLNPKIVTPHIVLGDKLCSFYRNWDLVKRDVLRFSSDYDFNKIIQSWTAEDVSKFSRLFQKMLRPSLFSYSNNNTPLAKNIIRF
jgi:hypothetical protein